MTVVSVRGLRKNFTVKTKLPGLSGSLRAVLRPEIHTVEAVKGISLDLEKGELLAFIGPNGAGKSTTIKMLTGILYPTAGQAQVLGYVPWRQRRQLAYHIGSVFGQKPQLWYHLPAIDTFHLFAKIYELDAHAFRQRLDFLVAAFEIGDLLYTPVRLFIRFDWGQFARVALMQTVWIAALALGLALLYRYGIRRLSINGG